MAISHSGRKTAAADGTDTVAAASPRMTTFLRKSPAETEEDTSGPIPATPSKRMTGMANISRRTKKKSKAGVALRMAMVSALALLAAGSLPAVAVAQTDGQVTVVPRDEATFRETLPELLRGVSEDFAGIYDAADVTLDNYNDCFAAGTMTATSVEVTGLLDQAREGSPQGADPVLNQSSCLVTFYEGAIGLLEQAANTHLQAQQGLTASLGDIEKARLEQMERQKEAEAALGETTALREALASNFQQDAARLANIPEDQMSVADKQLRDDFKIQLRLLGIEEYRGQTLRRLAEREVTNLTLTKGTVEAWAAASGQTAKALTVDIRDAQVNIELIEVATTSQVLTKAVSEILDNLADMGGGSKGPFPVMPQLPAGLLEDGSSAAMPMPESGGTLDLVAIYAELGIDLLGNKPAEQPVEGQ